MAQNIDQLWNLFHQLKQDIEDLLDNTRSDLPRTLADARAGQAPNLQGYVALQERLFNLRVYLRDFVNQVTEIESAKTQVSHDLNDLQRQLDNAPSRKDYDSNKEQLKNLHLGWNEVKPEYERLKTQKKEMDKNFKDFATKAADYKRLKELKTRLNANDSEYRDLLKKSNELETSTEELNELRKASRKTREEADELADLRCKTSQMKQDATDRQQLRSQAQAMEENAAELERLGQNQDARNNPQRASTTTVSTTPLDSILVSQSAVQVQADQNIRIFTELLSELSYAPMTASVIASHAAMAGAQAYIHAISTGQAEADALAVAEDAAGTAAKDRGEDAHAAGEEAYTMAKDRGRSSPASGAG